MNFKERGVTVGDLLIILIVILSTIFIINKLKDSDKQSHLFLNSIEVTTTLIS